MRFKTLEFTLVCYKFSLYHILIKTSFPNSIVSIVHGFLKILILK